MPKRITVPDGKVAVLLDRQLATELVSLYAILGAGRLPSKDDLPSVKAIAKEAWFDTFLALDDGTGLYRTPLSSMQEPGQ